METELVKMSSKGQLVVPQSIREKESFRPGERFMPFPVADGVLFKRTKLPDAEKEFSKIAKDIEQTLKKNRVASSDVAEAVRWARRKQ